MEAMPGPSTLIHSQFSRSHLERGFGSNETPLPPPEKWYLPIKPSLVKWSILPKQLITGSYNERHNSVDLWSCSDDSINRLSTVTVRGDTSGLAIDQRGNAFVSTSYGDLLVLRGLDHGRFEVSCSYTSEELVGESEGLTTIEIFDDLVGVVSANGRVAVFSLNESVYPTVIDPGVDSINCISFLRTNELVAGNLRGQISIYDFRDSVNSPVSTFRYNSRESGIGITHVSPFPFQKHMLVAAGTDGSLTFWDLRALNNEKCDPVPTVITAHSAPISSMTFHKTRPTNLFTSSVSGDLWHWENFKQVINAVHPVQTKVISLTSGQKFPINCVDVHDQNVVFGCDNDSLTIINNLRLGN